MVRLVRISPRYVRRHPVVEVASAFVASAVPAETRREFRYTVDSQRMDQRLAAASVAANGSVVIQASKICPTTLQLASPLTLPMPNNAPQDICVVETGIPQRLAPITSNEVTRFAEKP